MVNDIYVDAEKYGLSVAGLDYVNENMRVVDVDMIKECIEECVEDLCLTEDGKKMNFEGFCDVLWTNNVVNELRKFKYNEIVGLKIIGL